MLKWRTVISRARCRQAGMSTDHPSLQRQAAKVALGEGRTESSATRFRANNSLESDALKKKTFSFGSKKRSNAVAMRARASTFQTGSRVH